MLSSGLQIGPTVPAKLSSGLSYLRISIRKTTRSTGCSSAAGFVPSSLAWASPGAGKGHRPAPTKAFRQKHRCLIQHRRSRSAA
jgi:hypothetical protein